MKSWNVIFSALSLAILSFISPATLRADSYGTGFFISADGYLVTNHHVIKGGQQFFIRYKEQWIPATVIRKDATNDLAILKAQGKDFPNLALKYLADVRSGDTSFTVGFPDPTVLGFAPKTTKGEISALSGIKDDVRFYQTTVAIQPGNSGGPLCDVQGNVLGVTSLVLNSINRMQNAGYVPQNVNYALKTSYIRPLVGTIRGLSENLAKPSEFTSFRDAQRHVENAVISIKSLNAPAPILSGLNPPSTMTKEVPKTLRPAPKMPPQQPAPSLKPLSELLKDRNMPKPGGKPTSNPGLSIYKGTPREIGETVEGSLNEFLKAHYQTIQGNDAKKWAGMFSKNPYYCFAKGNASKEYLTKDRQELINRYPKRSVTFDPATIKPINGGKQAEAAFTYHYKYIGRGKTASGVCREVLKLEWMSDRWRIISFNEYVVKN